MRNIFLWSNGVFEKKKANFHEFDFEVLESMKAHNFVWQGCFSFIFISQLRRPIEFIFSQVYYVMHMLRYTKWKTGLRRLPVVSSVLKICVAVPAAKTYMIQTDSSQHSLPVVHVVWHCCIIAKIVGSNHTQVICQLFLFT